MRISPAALILAVGLSATTVHAQAAPVATQAPVAAAVQAQTPTPTSATAEATAPVAATPVITASSLLQPALTQSQATLTTLKIDKWKKGSVRDEAGANVNALLRDLQTNIPPLITAADAEPNALSRAVPLVKHLDAFYDVLLRVEEASRVSAPNEQISALQQTLLDVNKARIAFDDQLQAQAATHEKQIFDLQTELRTEKEAAAARQAKESSAAATPCKPATPARRKRRSTTTKPAAGTPATSKPQ